VSVTAARSAAQNTCEKIQYRLPEISMDPNLRDLCDCCMKPALGGERLGAAIEIDCRRGGRSRSAASDPRGLFNKIRLLDRAASAVAIHAASLQTTIAP
jgi:hypothetical protein